MHEHGREDNQQRRGGCRVKRATDIAREYPARNHSEWYQGHHCIFKDQIRLVRLNIEKRAASEVEKMIAEDEEVPTERHRRWVAVQGEHGVVHAVPVADEWIDKIQD